MLRPCERKLRIGRGGGKNHGRWNRKTDDAAKTAPADCVRASIRRGRAHRAQRAPEASRRIHRPETRQRKHSNCRGRRAQPRRGSRPRRALRPAGGGTPGRGGVIPPPPRWLLAAGPPWFFKGPADLLIIIRRPAKILNTQMDEGGAKEIARRCRGTPRIANRLLRRSRDFAEVRAAGRITRAVAQEALQMLGVDENGLDEVDRNLMLALLDKYGGGPVGLGTLSAALAEEEDAIEEMYEPYLMQIGMIDRTPRGRVATPRAYEYFGRELPRRQPRLF